MSWHILMLRELRPTLALALPMAANQVTQMLMGVADTVMIGRVGVVPLAAAAFANTVLTVFLVFGLGLLSSVSVAVSQAFGAKRPADAGDALRGGLWLAGGAGLVFGAAVQASAGHLEVFGQPPEVAEGARLYLIICGWSLFPLFLGFALKGFSESLNRPWEPFGIMMGGVGLNVVLNALLIFGWGGFPAMGLEGAAWATLAARVATLAGLAAYIRYERRFCGYLPRIWWRAPRWQTKVMLLRIGLPVAGQTLAEVGAFAFASVMMGWLGAVPLAAHQIAITCAATAFMVPLGLANAVTIRVGQAFGACELVRVRPIGFGGLALAALAMAFTALLFAGGGAWVVAGFSTDAAVRELAARLLLVAALFQVVDGLQVVGVAALRGLNDVRIPMVMVIVAYWALALPVGYGLAFMAGEGPLGLWIGLAIGLGVAAFLFARRLWRLSGVHALAERRSLTPVGDHVRV